MPNAIDRPSTNIPISTVNVAATVVETVARSERNASSTIARELHS